MTNSGITSIILLASAFFPLLSFGQEPQESKRIFGIIPNNRTSPSLKDYKPLSPKEKFEIARHDSFDRGTVVLAAAFAGEAPITNDSGRTQFNYSEIIGNSTAVAISNAYYQG